MQSVSGYRQLKKISLFMTLVHRLGCRVSSFSGYSSFPVKNHNTSKFHIRIVYSNSLFELLSAQWINKLQFYNYNIQGQSPHRGWALNKVLYGEDRPRGPTLYSYRHYFFDRKGTPFIYLLVHIVYDEFPHKTGSLLCLIFLGRKPFFFKKIYLSKRSHSAVQYDSDPVSNYCALGNVTPKREGN